MTTPPNCPTASRTKALSDDAERELAHLERRNLASLDEVRADAAREGSDLTSLIRRCAEGVFVAEHLAKWHRAIRTAALSDAHPDVGLEDLLEELEDRCDAWTPTNSTSLISRAEGEAELVALRKARKLVRTLLKLNLPGAGDVKEPR